MSMNSKNLSVLAYVNGFTLWHYKTEDAKSAVSASGYFNSVANIFNVGDLIIANQAINGNHEEGFYREPEPMARDLRIQLWHPCPLGQNVRRNIQEVKHPRRPRRRIGRPAHLFLQSFRGGLAQANMNHSARFTGNSRL